MLADIRGFSFKWVVPYDTAFSPAMLRNPTVWIMLVFGFYPLLSLRIDAWTTESQLASPLMIYCALAWAGYFYYFIGKRSVDFRTGIAITLFTAFIGIHLVTILWKMPPFSLIRGYTDTGADIVKMLIGFTLGTGIIEELTKAVPVLIIAYGMGKLEKPMDGIFYGFMSGLGFGIAEGVLYITASLGNPVAVLLRITSLPFMHALWAGIIGYFIGLAQVNKERGTALVVIGFTVSVVSHGAYDAFGGVISLGIAVFSWLLFSAYIDRSQHMVAELAQAELTASRENAVQTIFRNTYLPNVHGAASPTGETR